MNDRIRAACERALAAMKAHSALGPSIIGETSLITFASRPADPTPVYLRPGFDEAVRGGTPGRVSDAYGNRFFEVGDLVTRDGTDIHRVVDHNGSDGHAPDGMTVVCVKAPSGGWTKVGEEEFNVCRRYEWLDEAIEGETKP